MPNAQSRHLESESWAVNDKTEQSGRWLAMKKILDEQDDQIIRFL